MDKKKVIPINVLIKEKIIYKKYIKGNFDFQVAFLEGPITRIFKYGNNIKKIVWIHNDISKMFGNSFKSKIKLLIDKNNYKRYDKLIFVSNDNKEVFDKKLKIKDANKKEEVIL